MPTTSNFGWTTPADTDLVKDGAAAIRTLGNGIDTSLVDLKGGTTGQVLSKASNTDLDFTWVAQDDSNAIQNALLTTTGDTIYASAASTPARLGIGTTGQVLTVSGGVPVWSTISAGGLTLLSTTTLSSTATTVSSINQTYENLYVEVENATWNTSNSRLQLELNSAGVTIFTQRLGAATVITYNQSTLEASNGSQDWSRTAGVNFVSFEIFNYAATNTYKAFALNSIYLDTSDTAQRTASFFGGVGSSNAITSITIKFGGNTITGGTMRIYGVK